MSVATLASEANLWRQNSPGASGWQRSPRPDATNKYFMVSTDCHFIEPDAWAQQMPPELAAYLPRVEVDADGKKWMVQPGMRRAPLVMTEDQGDDEDKLRAKAAKSPEQIIREMDLDGVDVQVAFPTKALLITGISDPKIQYAMAANYNDFLIEYFTPIKDRVVPLPFLPTCDLDLALKELKRLAKTGFFRAVQLPCKPIWGPANADDPNYNLPMYDPLWAAIQDTDLGMAFHVSTGMDPRKARGNGGAVINYAAHAMTSAVEPLINLCASGVLERFPKLRFATIEAGIGWVPFALQVMDEAYKKHHMWVRPKLSKLPSEFYMENGFSSFQEDPVGLSFVGQRGYEDCFMWANDYPHAEGSWPHSAPAIERQMGGLTEAQRVKILGGNATRWLKIQDLAAARSRTV